jgi:hypothetical protein
MQCVILIGFLALLVFIIVRPMAAVSKVKAGIAAKAYVNTGSYGTPVWAAADCVADAQPAFPWDFGDASSRATRAKLYGKTQIDLSCQLVCRADDADATYQDFVDAAFDDETALDMLILDGAITDEGARGVRAHYLFSLSSQPQGRGDLVYSTFDIKPSYSTEGAPKSVVMGAASAPTFTAI